MLYSEQFPLGLWFEKRYTFHFVFPRGKLLHKNSDYGESCTRQKTPEELEEEEEEKKRMYAICDQIVL